MHAPPSCSTVNDLGTGSTKLGGVLVAALSVVGSGMQQILCGHMQRLHKLQSHQLLAATAPAQGLMLLIIGPAVDKAVSGTWVGQYVLTTPALCLVVLSCTIAVGVNVSQFMCLGRFSATTFQVLGHTKTILVLLISWLALGESMSAKKLMGMALAVAGMVAYGVFINQGSSSPKASLPPIKSGDQQPLLPITEKKSQP
jgi:solute carrier family 35 protein E3